MHYNFKMTYPDTTLRSGNHGFYVIWQPEIFQMALICRGWIQQLPWPLFHLGTHTPTGKKKNSARERWSSDLQSWDPILESHELTASKGSWKKMKATWLEMLYSFLNAFTKVLEMNAAVSELWSRLEQTGRLRGSWVISIQSWQTKR